MSAEDGANIFATHARQQSATRPKPMSAAHRRQLDAPDLQARRKLERRYLNGLIVLNQAQQEVHGAVLRHVASDEGAPAGPHDSLYVVGDRHGGKSLSVRLAAYDVYTDVCADLGLDQDQDPTVESEPGIVSRVIPVVWVTVCGSKKNFLEQTVEYYGYGDQGNSVQIAMRLSRYAVRHRTRLIVYDDIHQLAFNRKDAPELYDMMKQVHTELGIRGVTLVFLENPDPETGLLTLAEQRQMSGRAIPHWLNPMPFDPRLPEPGPDEVRWRDYLRDWEIALSPLLPDLEPGALCSVLGPHAWNRSQGNMGGITGLLKRATHRALDDPNPRRQLTITRDNLLTTPMPFAHMQAER